MSIFKGKLIVIEGPDKFGKTTQAKELVNNIASAKYVKPQILSALIYWMLRTGSAKTLPRLFQTIHFANMFLFQLFVLPFLKLKYDYIVLDRWWLSTVIYGKAEGLSWWYTGMLCDFLAEPDLMIVIRGVPFMSSNRSKDDSYESDTRLQRQVQELYGIWSAWYANIRTVLNTECEGSKMTRSIEDVNKDIQLILKDAL